MKILIVIPVQKEFDFLRQRFIAHGYTTEDSVVGRLPVVNLPDLDITLAQGGLGKAQFAIHTQHLLDTGPNWELVVCAGAAGGLVDHVAIGDIVVATDTIEHDFKSNFGERPRPAFAGAQTIIDGLKQVSAFDSFDVHFGTVASGDEDIVEAGRRESLQQTTGALAVAWEGAGGARACQFSQTPFVEIRSLTDAADHTAPSDFRTNLEVAMDNIVILITNWIKSNRSAS